MRVSKLVGEHFKEAPNDCVIASHSIMVRGGYIKQVGTGIFSLYTPAKRIIKKIEEIIREEMDRCDGQEVLFPVVMPASLWRESGRYDSIGSELLRFKDRNGSDMVLGMTHEEASVQLARVAAQTYTKFPYMIYQIQTKFRDEPRARGGLIRVREFTMKDAYSFHTSQEDLEKYYDVMYEAYNRIFKRAGLKNFIAVKSDSGMMGGSISHEFMLLTPIGEDTLVICPECGYKSNMEAANCIVENEKTEREELKLVHTPEVKKIADLSKFLSFDEKRLIKAVVYQENATDKYIICYIRGDLEVNETKLRNYLKTEIHPATITEGSGIVQGYIGPIGNESGCKAVFDQSLIGIENGVCGANKEDYHYSGVCLERDVPNIEYADFAKTYEGAICPVCGKKSITISNGIEIGNIFQLGTKYSKAMKMEYIDKDGETKNPIMGCYGIGLGRLCASVCEESHDDYGPIWPITIAPWEVEICNLRKDNEEVNSLSENLYSSLQKLGVDVLYDDRDVRPGFMFADADLYGCPIRVVVSPKTVERGCVEVSYRDKSDKFDLPVEGCDVAIADIVKKKLDELNNI